MYLRTIPFLYPSLSNSLKNQILSPWCNDVINTDNKNRDRWFFASFVYFLRCATKYIKKEVISPPRPQRALSLPLSSTEVKAAIKAATKTRRSVLKPQSYRNCFHSFKIHAIATARSASPQLNRTTRIQNLEMRDDEFPTDGVFIESS